MHNGEMINHKATIKANIVEPTRTVQNNLYNARNVEHLDCSSVNIFVRRESLYPSKCTLNDALINYKVHNWHVVHAVTSG